MDFVDKEFQRIESRESDIVATCYIDGVPSIFHLEIQNDNDATMPRRMLRYYVEIAMEFPRLPIHQYVIYIGKEKLRMKDTLQGVNLDYAYTLIDMHTIDCDELIKMETPDALVLAILCDFKGRDETQMLFEITKKLKEMTGENEWLFGQKMLMIEVLSENRHFQHILKEVENMLRNITLEQLPSYELGVERERARMATLLKQADDEKKLLQKQADEEKKRRVKLVRSLLQQQVPIDIIMTASGMNQEEIEALR